MGAADIRATRALIRHVRALWIAGGPDGRVHPGRNLMDGKGVFERVYPHGERGYHDGRGKRGKCRWCGQSCKPAKLWHRRCLAQYCAASNQLKNVVSNLYFWEDLKNLRCAECGGGGWIYGGDHGLEIDHKLAIGIAAESDDPRQWARAWWVGNLQFLCRRCHRDKTADDRRKMADLKRYGRVQGVPEQAAIRM